MRVRDCMTTKIVTLRLSTPLATIIETFKKNNFRVLPVVEDDGRLVGVVTFEDILKVFQPYSSDLQEMLKTIPFIDLPVEQKILGADISSEMGMLVIADDIMSTNLITIGPEEDISRAHSLMKLHNTKRLLVTEEEKLVGIITLFDIILALFKSKGVI